MGSQQGEHVNQSTTQEIQHKRHQVFFKGGITIKNLLVAPMDQDPILQKVHLDRCSRNIKRPLHPIFDHYNIIGHHFTLDNFSIVGREGL